MDQREVNDFANGLCKAAGFEGMRANPPDRVLIAQNENDLVRYYEGCKNNGVTFALVILPRKDSHIYSIVKEKAELVYGVITQCVLSKNMARANAMFYGNLLQKINTKLGGKNTQVVNRIQLFTKPIMIVGLSFSHPAPGSRNPSIVTASFSCDASGTKVSSNNSFSFLFIIFSVFCWKTSPTIKIHSGNWNQGSFPRRLEGILQESQRQEARAHRRLPKRCF